MKSYHALTVFLGAILLPVACSTRIQPAPDSTPATTSQPTSEPSSQPTSHPSATAPTASSSASSPPQILTACPEGLPGPRLVFVPHPQSPFCMDTTEVSQAHYAKFLADPQDKVPFQQTRCSANETFVPFQGSHLDDCDGKENYVYDPATRGELPIACIDWCDAAAYCAWAGKRLCGAVGGGGLDHDEGVLTGQWGYVCSQGGQSIYSYGNTYKKGICADEGGSSEKVGVTTRPQCAGASPPFSEIQSLTGNMMEFEDACENYPLCRIRGLSNDSEAEAQTRCDFFADGNTQVYSPNVGFRCCYN